ncbi:MAG: DUF4215 domain-containing protein, partial [Myxococcales bacterium]|nr:DUF4215 domain-containing protein [Myxococcales bacterium]
DLDPADGCSATCTVELGYNCTGTTPSVCTSTCGDGTKAADEACDDGDLDPADGCSATCTVELGYNCTGTTPSVCATTCGDGTKAASEACDDGDLDPLDGCSATCTVELGFNCTGTTPSICTSTCGDGTKAANEACDDGDLDPLDGCSATCTVELGYNCTGTTPSVCSTTCGDGIPAGSEGCDDGNASNNDDCPDGVGGTCQAATCSDGFLHSGGTGTESDVDCGGSCAACVNGDSCNVGADCVSGACPAGTCVAPAVVSTTPANLAAGVLESATVAVTFNAAMSPATLTFKSAVDDLGCSGAVQVSTDNFTTCIAFASAVMSGGDTIVTLTPAPALSYGSVFKIRVTTAALSFTGTALGAQFELADGFTTRNAPAASGVVISQVYGAGGNAGATYTNDFIELHNRGSVAVDVSTWSVQYGGTTGGSWTRTNLTGSIPAGGYYLVQCAAGAGGTQPLPPADAAGTLALGGTNGLVALVGNQTTLPSGCPASAVDVVAYGTASCFEGAAAAPPTSATTLSIIRPGTGCIDTNQNGADFITTTAFQAGNPRNSGTPLYVCRSVRNETADNLEADYCTVLAPLSVSVQTGTPLPTVTGQIYEAGVTEAGGASALVTAELGYGPRDTNPESQAGWTFLPTIYDVQAGNNDQYKFDGLAPAAGTYSYAYRFSLDAGQSWTYCDKFGTGDFGAGSNTGLNFETPRLPLMTVTP